MHLNKIILLVAVGLLCINARVLKRQKKVRQRPVSSPRGMTSCGCSFTVIETPCGCKSSESTYGGLGICNCPDIFLDKVECGCSYGILNSELPNYGRVPAIKLPQYIANYEAGIPIPAINLPASFDFVVDLPTCSAMSGYELPCQCKAPVASYQFIEGPCSCRMQAPVVEYLAPVELPNPIVTPYVEPYYVQAPRCNCQPQIIELPTCGCPLPKIECGCQSMNMPCGYQNIINSPCGCDEIKVSYGLPCGCENPVCGCQHVIQYGSQLPVLNTPCGCQGCQLSPVELPLYGYGCQSLPPPVIGCGGKYLRQVTLQPPFL